MKVNNKIESAYLAGLIDGDGCIMIYPIRINYRVKVDLTLQNINSLKQIQNIWGGRLTIGKKSKHLIWDGIKRVKYILESILFYSKLKKDEIGLGLYYINNLCVGSGHTLSPDQRKIAKSIYGQSREIKKEKYANTFIETETLLEQCQK